MSVYVLDTSCFITAKNKHYPFDIASSFWTKIQQLADAGKIVSIDKVKNEINRGNDNLKEWCGNNFQPVFFADSSLIIPSYQQVSTWASSRNDHFFPAAITEFLNADEADAWIIAYALANNNQGVVVTSEISKPGKKNRILIPDACNELGVSCMSVIDMLRALGETF